jgi:hypothetical protein
MAYTLEQYQQAIAKAQRAGDDEAAQFLIKEAAPLMTGAGSFREKLGAGMQDIVTGTKQLVGQASPEEVAEHNRIAKSATGGTFGGELVRGLGTAALAAPAMLVPGANSVVGAGLIGGGTGLLMPTEDENVVSGKAMNALTGLATGAGAQKALNVGGNVLKKTLGSGRDALRRFTGGGRQELAEKAFTETIPEAERAAAEQALSGAAAARQAPLAAGTSGAPITSGAATRNPALLAAEREARETGGMLGQPFRDLDEQAAQTQWQHLQQNLRGDVPKLSQAADDVYDDFISKAKLKQPFDPKDALWKEINGSLSATHNPTVKAELTRIADQFLSAKQAGDITSLHELRMTAFDDALSRLYQSDKKAAGILRNRIEGFKQSFDDEMDRALGSGKQWSKFRDDYSAAAQARGQGEAGNELLKKMEAMNPTPGGVPQLTGRRPMLGTAATETNQFGQPVYSPQGREALQTVRGEISDQLLPRTAAGPTGSATAQNLNPTSRVLGRAIQAQKEKPIGNLGDVASIIAGTVAGGPAGAVVAPVLRRSVAGIADRQAINIAERLIQLHTDPARAAAALARMNLPPQVKKSVAEMLARGAARPVPATAAAMTTQAVGEQQE